MTIRELRASVGEFFFKPISPYPLGVFRIAFGLCVCATLLLLHGDWLAWFGVHGWINMDTIEKAESGFRLNLFTALPADDTWYTGLYWLLLISSVALTLGIWARLSSIVVFLGLNSLNQRMPLILHGGDTFLRISAFFLMFAPSGAALSLDAAIKNAIGLSRAANATRISPLAQRLIQYQLAVVYLMSFWWKVNGKAWRNGTALFYVVNLREIQRFPIPGFFHDARILHLGAWAAMSFELLFPLLIWFRPFRNPLLLAGLLFHLCLEYALNIPMFQWDMLCAYALFLDAGQIRRFTTRLSVRTRSRNRAMTEVQKTKTADLM